MSRPNKVDGLNAARRGITHLRRWHQSMRICLARAALTVGGSIALTLAIIASGSSSESAKSGRSAAEYQVLTGYTDELSCGGNSIVVNLHKDEIVKLDYDIAGSSKSERHEYYFRDSKLVFVVVTCFTLTREQLGDGGEFTISQHLHSLRHFAAADAQVEPLLKELEMLTETFRKHRGRFDKVEEKAQPDI